MAAVTQLYQHDYRNRCCRKRWSKFPNHKEDQENLKKVTAEDPIIHRHTFKDSKWITDSFTIQCPLMKVHLVATLAEYQDFDLELEDWTFQPPFKSIVHRWDRLNSICDDTTQPPASKEAIVQMIKFLGPIVAPSVESLVQTKETGKITFDEIWQIFPPGELAMTTFYGVEAVCRVAKYQMVEACNGPGYWIINLEYVDWNGECCGYTSTKVILTYFVGLRHVVSLPVYPLSFNKSGLNIQARMIERGRKFEALRGYHFKTYVGTKILLEAGKPEKRPISLPISFTAIAQLTG